MELELEEEIEEEKINYQKLFIYEKIEFEKEKIPDKFFI